MTETQRLLENLCKSINGDDRGHCIYILSFDDYFLDYLDSENAIWVRKSKILPQYGEVFIPRFQSRYTIIKANDGARGYKPHKAIIDSRIPCEDIKKFIVPNLLICYQCNYF